MGQCGCGDMHLIAAHRVAGTENVLAVDEYWGCRECGTPIAITLRYFDAPGWLDWGRWYHPPGRDAHATPEPEMAADEYGGEEGFGWAFPLIGKAELVQAAREGEELKRVRLEDYATLADLLSDWGLELLQEALRQRSER